MDNDSPVPGPNGLPGEVAWGCKPRSTGHAPSVVFEVFPHEKKLRDGDAVGCFQAFPQAAAGERNKGFRGEHPGIQKRHDAGNDYAAFLDRGGSPVLIHAVTMFTSKVGEVNFLAGVHLLDGKETRSGCGCARLRRAASRLGIAAHAG